MKIYLVHRGFVNDKNNVKQAIGVVTYRASKSDAAEIAQLLNEKIHEVRYFEWLASKSNQALAGGRELIMRADTPENRSTIDKMRAEASKDSEQNAAHNFSVTEFEISGSDEEKLKNAIAEENAKSAEETEK